VEQSAAGNEDDITDTQIDPSAAKNRRIRRRKMIRRKSAEKNMARGIRRQILFAENLP